jgi:predicted ribosome quality control (RQC) complex YloA/Tae2 family protein
MFNNYLYLKRAVIELNELIIGCKIVDVFSQEKDKAVIVLQKNNLDAFLIINTTANLPYFLLRNKYSKAKKNTYDFFRDTSYKTVEKVLIAESDRIIKIILSDYELIFSIRGAKTNLFLFKGSDFVESFKKTDESEIHNFKEELNELQFTSLFNKVVTDIKDFDKSIIKNEFPFVNNIILNEIKIRGDVNNSIAQVINEIFYSFISGDISVGYLEGKLRFFPNDLEVSKELTEVKEFENYFDALNYFLTSNFKKDKFDEIYKTVNNELEKRLSFLSNKIYNLEQRVKSGSKENEYYKFGNLILSNIYSIKTDEEIIELTDYETDSQIKVKIDQQLSPSENANKYFDKAKDERKNYAVSVDLYNKSKNEYESLLKVKNKLSVLKDINELKEIKDYLKIKEKHLPKMNKEEINIKYYHFILEDKYHVFVGKDSKSNDLLTLKFAKQNDLWFHARGLPGSHVVLRIENTKEAVPKNIIKSAASIAAFYSKAKTAGTVPVSYTFKKFVIKKKGMEPGKVLLLKESSILVKPEIPLNAVMENEE